MRLRCTSLLSCSIDRLRTELEKPILLQHVALPMLAFAPVDPPQFPDRWTPGRYRAELRIGGWVPIGEHTLNPQPLPPRSEPLVWHDAGYSDLIQVWDHKIELEDFHQMMRYSDVVEIHAGPLTLPAWLFALAFYTHRQRRLNRLVASRFDYAHAD